MTDIFQFLTFLDQLKCVERKSIISDGSRRENSAEHSWHMAMAAWTLADELQLDLDRERILKLALVHDVCEIGVGDIYVYAQGRDQQTAHEHAYMQQFATMFDRQSEAMYQLWLEYEAQQSPESRLVKVCDHLLPFLLNLANDGAVWQENKVSKSMVLGRNGFITDYYPAIGEWMLAQIDQAVANGWLIDQ